MATWTAPITWTTGAVTAAQFNQQIRDNETWLKGAFTQLNVTSDAAKAKITPALVGARAYKAAAQTLTTGVTTAVQLDSERFDSDAFHDTVTANTRLTIPASFGGYYIFGFSISFAYNATGIRSAIVTLNATTDIARDQEAAVGVSAAPTQFASAGLYQFAAADYIELFAFQNCTANLNVEANNNSSPEFWIHRLSST